MVQSRSKFRSSKRANNAIQPTQKPLRGFLSADGGRWADTHILHQPAKMRRLTHCLQKCPLVRG